MPLDERAVVVATDRLSRVRSLDPGLWRMQVEAGVRTATVARRAREEGLWYPPDPGAWESSHIGGNIATNAGGPHCVKHGVTRAWVTGLEVVLAPGELVTVGGPVRKDVAGYDLVGLLCGSEGTLGLVTAAWLRLIPAPEQPPVALAAVFATASEGCAAVERVLVSGVVPEAIEYLDGETLRLAGAGFPGGLPHGASFLVLCEAAAGEQAPLLEALGPGAACIGARELWRWRDGVGLAVTAARGGKLSEDVVVPLDRLAEAITATVAIGERHDLPACSWGHAGDANLHSTFLLDPDDAAQLARAQAAVEELFAMARVAQARPARAPVVAGRRRRAPGDQGRPRPAGSVQPGQEDAVIARVVLRTVAAALCVAAGVAIAALLGGDFSRPADAIVLTSLSFAAAVALVELSASSAWFAPDGSSCPGVVGGAQRVPVARASPTGAPGATRRRLKPHNLRMAPLAGAGAALLERRRTPAETLLGALCVQCVAVAFVLATVAIWTESASDTLLRAMGLFEGGDAFSRLIGVVLVLAVLGTLLAPLLRRVAGRNPAGRRAAATLDHVQIAAPRGCEQAARAFYGELLGLPERPKPAALAARGGVWFDPIHVGVEEPFAAARKAHPALRVPDLDRLVARLRAAGHEPRFDDAIPGVRRYYVDDPWGNRVEVTE